MTDEPITHYWADPEPACGCKNGNLTDDWDEATCSACLDQKRIWAERDAHIKKVPFVGIGAYRTKNASSIYAEKSHEAIDAFREQIELVKNAPNDPTFVQAMDVASKSLDLSHVYATLCQAAAIKEASLESR